MPVRRELVPDEIATRALSWLDATDGPFFLWTHFMDPHGPYDPPQEYQERFHGEDHARKFVTDPRKQQRQDS